jgi:predicted nuclease of predicted toxin-antitoxin system
MIHSSIQDNWFRVDVIHAIARDLFLQVKNEDFRKRMLCNGEPFPFSPADFEAMEKEACIVGMVKAWAVVAIESLTNHFLAETINNALLVSVAIEYPKQILDKLKISKMPKSDLGRKLLIYSNSREDAAPIIAVADDISDVRNSIVHDKPFEIINLENGDVKIVNLGTRGNETYERHNYESLEAFFDKCDRISNYLYSTHPSNDIPAPKRVLVDLMKRMPT